MQYRTNVYSTHTGSSAKSRLELQNYILTQHLNLVHNIAPFNTLKNMMHNTHNKHNTHYNKHNAKCRVKCTNMLHYIGDIIIIQNNTAQYSKHNTIYKVKRVCLTQRG